MEKKKTEKKEESKAEVSPTGGMKMERKVFLRKHDLIRDAYEIAPKAFASGSYGEVRSCVHKLTHEKRAVKMIPKYKMSSVDNFLNEIEIMRTVVRILSKDFPHFL